jgi:hypothetical protein
VAPLIGHSGRAVRENRAAGDAAENKEPAAGLVWTVRRGSFILTETCKGAILSPSWLGQGQRKIFSFSASTNRISRSFSGTHGISRKLLYNHKFGINPDLC